jgi:hypothetical protein
MQCDVIQSPISWYTGKLTKFLRKSYITILNELRNLIIKNSCISTLTLWAAALSHWRVNLSGVRPYVKRVGWRFSPATPDFPLYREFWQGGLIGIIGPNWPSHRCSCAPRSQSYKVAKRWTRSGWAVSFAMGDSSYRLHFDRGKIEERSTSNTPARKSILERVKLQSLVAKCCKMKKI